MIILGIESTAHTFGVGIMNSSGEVLANVKDSFTSDDAGMIPDKVANHHKEVGERILAKAFEQAQVSWENISLISYSAGPGLDPCLWAGYHFAKLWSQQHNKKLVAVNHCCAHLSIGKVWNKLEDPCYLYVSGVNTQILVQEENKYHVLGETLDIGLGNMLDKLGRILGLGFPAGAKIEQLAKTGKYIELPYVVKGMDVSFSGILTRVEQLWKKRPSWAELLKMQGKISSLPDKIFQVGPGQQIIVKASNEELNKRITQEDLCFSVQEVCFAMCTEVVERAMANTNKKELLLVGGVGANQRFCEMLNIMCQERGATFYKVPMDLAGDQGAMIAWEGYLRGEEYGDIEINPHWRADEV